ncbi:MAG: hypothetical protein ISS25_01250 [Nanoarchaeota archaeon]|nr:hypothetical protein [DPANN group archaeon]MBL7116441.1 hypothetical protein [Nanoarchaeota archaeon]
MPTISHIVNKFVEKRPILQHALSMNIVNFANLAERYKEEIEKELGKDVKHSAVIMAFRRYAEKMQEKEAKVPEFDYNSDITMKTNLVDICVVKSTTFFSKLKNIYEIINYEKGDALNIIHGNNETVIITNEKHKDNILKILEEEKISNIENDVVSLALKFNPEFLHTPGVISNVVRRFAWENINIMELITTTTEMTFILDKNDVMRAYNLLQELVDKGKPT